MAIISLACFVNISSARTQYILILIKTHLYNNTLGIYSSINYVQTLFIAFCSLLMMTSSDHCVLLPLNQMIGMGFGMLCVTPTAEEFSMGWNKRIANEYSGLDAWMREWTQKLFICFEATIKSRRPQKGELRLRSFSTQASDMCLLWCVVSCYERGLSKMLLQLCLHNVYLIII